MRFYKYQGAGNDFLLADNRQGSMRLRPDQIVALCDRRYGFGADGLMLLERSGVADFKMVFYNPDGSGGMMCGNGGRCIVAFAAFLGFTSFSFEAADGMHEAVILETDTAHTQMVVRLKMVDVFVATALSADDWFVFTGARHRVRFLAEGLADWPVAQEGCCLRHDPAFAPEGTNVNFVQVTGSASLQVRTYEKGVEAETWACGTGIVASCVAANLSGRIPASKDTGRVQVLVQALRDRLEVDFQPHLVPTQELQSGQCIASDVWLTGPAVQVGEVIATTLPLKERDRFSHPGI